MYNKITTPGKGVKAIKEVTLLNVNKASGIPNPSPLITKKQEIISMQINPLDLLTTGVVHKLEPALNIGKLLHLGSPTSEIYISKNSPAGPPLVKDSQHNISNK